MADGGDEHSKKVHSTFNIPCSLFIIQMADGGWQGGTF